MNAIEFLKQYSRMCTMYRGCCGCPLEKDYCAGFCENLSEEQITIIVDKTVQWSKEHPIITNSKKFEEVFGQHSISDLTICEIRPISHEIIPIKSNWWNEPYEEPDHDT